VCNEVEPYRTGEKVGTPVVAFEHGEHVLDAGATRRRVQFLDSIIPAPPRNKRGMKTIQIQDGNNTGER
jgi:hypothetical protein